MLPSTSFSLHLENLSTVRFKRYGLNTYWYPMLGMGRGKWPKLGPSPQRAHSLAGKLTGPPKQGWTLDSVFQWRPRVMGGRRSWGYFGLEDGSSWWPLHPDYWVIKGFLSNVNLSNLLLSINTKDIVLRNFAVWNHVSENGTSSSCLVGQIWHRETAWITNLGAEFQIRGFWTQQSIS